MPEPRRSRSQGSNGKGGKGHDEERPRSERANGSRRSKLSARQAVERVRSEFPALLGRPVEAVLGVQRDDEEGWQVTVQVVELARIPNSTDVLGAYAVTLDEDGELVGYQRRRRYNRGQADED